METNSTHENLDINSSIRYRFENKRFEIENCIYQEGGFLIVGVMKKERFTIIDMGVNSGMSSNFFLHSLLLMCTHLNPIHIYYLFLETMADLFYTRMDVHSFTLRANV